MRKASQLLPFPACLAKRILTLLLLLLSSFCDGRKGEGTRPRILHIQPDKHFLKRNSKQEICELLCGRAMSGRKKKDLRSVAVSPLVPDKISHIHLS